MIRCFEKKIKKITWQPQVPWSLTVFQAGKLHVSWTSYLVVVVQWYILSDCLLCLYQICKILQEFLQQPYQSLSQGIVSCNEVVFAEYSKIIIPRSHCLHFRNGNTLANKCKILQYQNVRSVPLLLKNHNKQKKKKKSRGISDGRHWSVRNQTCSETGAVLTFFS